MDEKEIREKIAEELRTELGVLLEKPGLMNALGTYMVALRIVKGEK